MQKSIRLFVVTAAIFLASIALAAIYPVGLAMVPPIQFPPSDSGVTGLRFSVLYERHRDMHRIDLAMLGNVTDQSFVGVAITGGANIHHEMTMIMGLEVAVGVNYMKEKAGVYGVQIAVLMNWMNA